MKGIPGTKHIHYHSGRYRVRKIIRYKQIIYGTFKTLQEAINHRDYCIKNRWSTNCIQENINKYICKRPKGYEVNYMVNGVQEYQGLYHTIEEAREVKDLLVKYNGDWDRICECPDYDNYTYLNHGII